MGAEAAAKTSGSAVTSSEGVPEAIRWEVPGAEAALAEIAAMLRRNILRMIFKARSGHPGSSLSAADLVTVLYYDEMRVDPADPAWATRDRFLLSKGHGCPVLYQTFHPTQRGRRNKQSKFGC